MKPKISAVLIIIVLLGVSANTARYAINIKPKQPTTTTTTNYIQTAIVDLNNSSLITSADVGIGQDSL